MKNHILTTVLLAGLSVSVSAQESGDSRDARERRERGPRGPGRMMDRIPDGLGLDDVQRQQWDEIIADHQSQMGEWRGRIQELRQARRDGDEARVAELEEQIAGDAWNPMESVQESLDAIKPVLDAEQLERFSDINERLQQRRESFAARGADGRPGGGPRGPDRMLDRVAESLEMSEEQRASLDQIADGHRSRMQDAGPLIREMRQVERAGDTQRAEELRIQLEELGALPRESLDQAMNEVESILDDQQAGRYSQMRRNIQQRNQRRVFFRDAENGLPNALDMDPEQRAQYDDFLRTQRQDMRAQWEQTRAIRREMGEARAAGDEARLEELQMELEMSQPDQAGMQAEFLDDLRGLLRQDQLPLLQGFYPNVVVVPAQRPDDVRNILRAALRTGLDRGQRAEWRVIMREAMKSIHEIRGKDKEAGANIADEARTKIEALLTETQLVRFEKELKRLRRGKKRARPSSP